jgi:hypothetical protein
MFLSAPSVFQQADILWQGPIFQSKCKHLETFHKELRLLEEMFCIMSSFQDNRHLMNCLMDILKGYHTLKQVNSNFNSEIVGLYVHCCFFLNSEYPANQDRSNDNNS